MNPFRTLTIPAQVADHLRREVEEGRLQGMMPGVLRLERQTGVNRKTVEAALRILEADGLLEAQGVGKRRRIVPSVGTRADKSLRVTLLLFERQERGADFVLETEHQLAEAGHRVNHAPRTLMDLEMNVEKLARMVARTEADAWVVFSGSREVLAWFASQGIPVMAVFGRRRTLPVASVGADKIPGIREATRALLGLGHRRIVFLSRKVQRLPEPSAMVKVFMDELAAYGVSPGPFHLPDWTENVKGLEARFESIFRVTPPTAMIIDEPPFFVAALHFLARKGIRVPGDVSLVCTDKSPDFAWCQPQVSHIRWDSGPVVRRIVRWAGNVSRGRKDLRQTLTPAEFVVGGTIGPVKG